MAKSTQNRVSPYLYWALGAIFLVAGVFIVRSLTREQLPVVVASVSYRTLRKTVSTNGKVEPVSEWQAHAPFAGIIEKIFVSVGDHVTKGQLLVKMDDTDARAKLASSAAALSNAQLMHQDMQQGGSLEERNRFDSNTSAARLEQQQAAANLAATQSLSAKGAASAGEVAAAQQRLRSAELSLQAAQQSSSQRYSKADLANSSSRLAESQAALAAAQSGISSVNMRTPLSGTVYSIPVSEYDFVPSGDDILDVADLTRIQVRAYFDEPDIGGLARGQKVDIVWDAKIGTVWHGHIDRTPTTVITYGTRNVGECIITVDDARGDLLPNTNVTVTVTEMAREHALSVPREALRTDGANNYVYRIVNQKLARTPVQVGVVNLTDVEILGGLAADDVVVLGAKSNSVELTDGLSVKAIN